MLTPRLPAPTLVDLPCPPCPRYQLRQGGRQEPKPGRFSAYYELLARSLQEAHFPVFDSKCLSTNVVISLHNLCDALNNNAPLLPG